MNFKKYFFLISCLFAITMQAQTSLNLYPINGDIGVKFFSSKKISLEPRLNFSFGLANGESNMFLNTELHTTVNFLRNDDFNMYSGIGLGMNVLQNWTKSNFSGTIPLGATYYLNSKKLLAIIGECGLKITALDFIKIKTYALIGLQINLKKN